MEKMLKFIPEEHREKVAELKRFKDDMMSGKIDITERNGKKFPPGFMHNTAKYVKEEWDGIRENDVFLASFPKTGTNWCTTVLLKIVAAKNPQLQETYANIPLPLLALEVGPETKFKIVDALPLPRRVLATHLEGEDFPVEKATKKGAKIIYILRNPKDQTVSWFHFTQNVPGFKSHREQYPKDWKSFQELYFAGKHAMFVNNGDWYPEHILSWYKYKHQDNVKFVYYEDMKKDLEAEIRNMAEFLNVELNDEQVHDIAKSCGFDAMKKNVEAQNGDVNELRTSFNLLRKGQVGGWKEYFTVSQSEAVDAEFEQKLANTDIKFTYEL